MSKVTNPHLEKSNESQKNARTEGDYNFDSEYQVEDSEVNEKKAVENKDLNPHLQNSGKAQGTNLNKALGTGGTNSLSKGADINQLNLQWTPEVNSYIKNLAKQGLSSGEIANKVNLQFGLSVSEADLLFAKEGTQGQINDAIFNGNYPQYNQYSKQMQQAGGSNYNWSQQQQFFLKMLQDQQASQQVQGQVNKAKKESKEADLKMNAILFLVMTGNITGALRAMWQLMDQEKRKENSILLNQLTAVTNAKNQTLMALNTKAIPRTPNASMDEKQAARLSQEQQKYQLFVQTTNTMLGDLSQTRQQLFDRMGQNNSELNNFIQFVEKISDEEARTTEKIVS